MGKRAYDCMKLAEGQASQSALKDAVARLVEQAKERSCRVRIELKPGDLWHFRMDRLIEHEFGEGAAQWGGASGGGADGLRIEEALQEVHARMEDPRGLYEIWVVPEDKQGHHWSITYSLVREGRKGELGHFGDGAVPHE